MATYGPGQLAPLADPSRRAIFEALAEAPRALGELGALLPISGPAVSQHLKVLKDAGLVAVHAEGTGHVHRLTPDGLAVVRANLDRMWSDALASFAKLAESTESEKP